jgi:Spy/CpxP family protein refolding chaperone
MAEIWSRRLRILLVASLAVNLFFIAIVAAWAIAGPGYLRGMMGFGQPHSRLLGMPSPKQLRVVLDDQGDQILENMLESRRDAFHAKLEGLFEARTALAQAVAAEPFDQAKIEAALAVLREREAVLHAGAQDMILELTSQLSPDQRAKVAGLLKPNERWREKIAKP